MEESKKLKGSVFTHNHPDSSSFSPADIRTACNLEMKEIRITATKKLLHHENERWFQL
jgi:hypothetical protein